MYNKGVIKLKYLKDRRKVTKIILAKQKNSANKTKVNNNRIKKVDFFLYYLVNEKFMLLNT